MRGFRVKKLVILFTMVLWTLPSMSNQALDAIQEIAKIREAKSSSNSVQDSKAKMLSENYYFVYIFKATCPHCKKFAPTLKNFADEFHVHVDSYSFDGGPVLEFNAKPLTPELFKTFYVDGNYKPSVPALFLVNNHTHEAYAVLFGEAEPYELSQRVDKLLEHIEERFHA